MNTKFVLFILSLFLLFSCRQSNQIEQDLAQIYAHAQTARDEGDLLSATLRFHEVLSLSRKYRDKRFEGYTCQQLALLYAQNYEHNEAISYARLAIEALEEAQERIAANYSRIDLARQYFATSHKELAEQMVDSLLASQVDTAQLYYLYGLKADLCYARKDYTNASLFYQNIRSLRFPLRLDIYSQTALTEAHLGHQDVADSLLEQCLSLVRTGIDSVEYLSASHEIFALRGDYQRAWKDVSTAADIQGRAISSVLSHSVTHALQSYFEEQYKLERVRSQVAYLLIFIVVVGLVGVVFMSALFIRQSRQKVIAEMERADALTRDLNHITLLRQGTEAALSTLVQDKIKAMQRLAETYFSWSDLAVTLREEKEGKAMREEIIASFRSELRLLRSDEHFFPSIESALNVYSNNLMSRLREDFSGLSGGPKLKETDFHLLCLFFSGFSTKSIGFMMDMNDEAVRARKYRYRQLFISQSGTNMKEYYQRLSKQ